MAGITRKSLREPDATADFGAHGEGAAMVIGDSMVWRSRLLPGWSWDEDIKPLTDGLRSCPLYHHEYVLSGSIRYRMEDGTEIVAVADDYLFIEPGHRAWVIGEEPCELLDW
jgi:hypothetical protein